MDTNCSKCMLRVCQCGYMYRHWTKEEVEGVIRTLEYILRYPNVEGVLQPVQPVDYPHVVDGNIVFVKPMTFWERWQSRKKRKSLETLWVGAEFRFRPDCPLVVSGQCSELQAVVQVSSWDIDGYGNYCYTITSRGLNGHDVTFGTSTYGKTTGLRPDVRPKYILIKD